MGLQPLRFRSEDELRSDIDFPDHTVRMQLQGLLFATSLGYEPFPLVISKVSGTLGQAALQAMFPMSVQMAIDMGMPAGEWDSGEAVSLPEPRRTMYTWAYRGL